MPGEDERFVKIICMGDAQTGKSCALRAFLGEPVGFQAYIPSITTSFTNKESLVNGQPMTLQLWDVAPPREPRTYQRLIPSNCDKPDIVMLFFDTTKRETLNTLEKYLTELDAKEIERKKIILVGTKNDLISERQIFAEVARTWATQQRIPTYFDVSATKASKVLETQFLQAIEHTLRADTPAPVAPSQYPIIDVIAQPAPPSRSLFCGLFCGLFSSVPAHNPYLLTYGNNTDPDFSNDFRAIYGHLYTNSWVFHKSTVAKAVLDNNSPLNQSMLSEHGYRPQNRSSRTKQTLDILEQLRTIQGKSTPKNSVLEANNMRQFLEKFSAVYYYAHLNTNGISFVISSYPKDSWVWKSDLSQVLPKDLKAHLIDVLCRAVEKPNSRTAAAVTRTMDSSTSLEHQIR